MNTKQPFFVSDTHFGHANIIKYSNRPFKNADEMDEHMIRVWNECVAPDDDVYHLGDFFFHDEDRAAEILKRLNGRIHFIWGNHDQIISRSKRLQARFSSIRDYYELRVPDPDGFQGMQRIVLFHFPIMSWNKMHRGNWHIHGHCHHNLTYPFKGRIMDAGVDGVGYNYGPIPYSQVKTFMTSVKEPEYLDHHGNR